MEDSRRDFLKKGLLAGVGAMAIPDLAKAVVKEHTEVNAPKITLKKEAVILMQGDSITDAGRDRANAEANSLPMLGSGYSLFVASQLLAKHAGKQLKIYNRGVGGDKVFQLRDRWDPDCFAFAPDVLSILIGANDHWHTLTSGYDGTVQVYEKDYRALLTYTKEKIPGVQLVIGEPFVLKGGHAVNDDQWTSFHEYRAVAKKLAQEFNAVFVPYQAGFDAALKQAPTSYWVPDGVHPDLSGRQLMANMWLEATGLK